MEAFTAMSKESLGVQAVQQGENPCRQYLQGWSGKQQQRLQEGRMSSSEQNLLRKIVGKEQSQPGEPSCGPHRSS